MNKPTALNELVSRLSIRDSGEFLSPTDLESLAQALGVQIVDLLEDREMPPSVGEALGAIDLMSWASGIEGDLQTLPQKEGDVLPSVEKLSAIESAFENNEALDALMEKLLKQLEAEGLSSVSEFYNAFRIPNEAQLALIWSGICEDPRMQSAVDLITSGMAASKDKSEEDLKNKLSGKPSDFIHKGVESGLLVNVMLKKISVAFSKGLMRRAQGGGLKLLPHGEAIEDPETFNLNLEISIDFEEMDEGIYIDSLGNSLGQAQTANHGAAEAYFRGRENLGEEVQNNFGYVYLSAKQAEELGIGKDSSAREFRYMGAPYRAIPVGLYFARKFPEKYAGAIQKLRALAEKNAGTPVGEYYTLLADYYELGDKSPLRGDAFLKAYFDLCYEAERAWVRYVRYTVGQKLPILHVHPFERYGTPSTKSHELALCLVNGGETQEFLEAKARFQTGAQHFLDESGVAENYPVMAEQSLRHVDSAVMVSLSARLHSSLGGTIAENIPDEEAGKKEGIVTLFDTDFARKAIPGFRGAFMKARDGLGGLSSSFDRMVRRPQAFMDHYKLFVGGHELNHNMYKGKKRPTQGTKDGLSINTIEEAKASEGIAFMFKNANALEKAEIKELQGALPLVIPWMLSRLNPAMLKQHASAPYLREGSVLLEHMLKTDLLQITRLKVTEEDLEEVLELKGEPGEDEFEFFRFNLSPQAIQAFVTRCAKFMKRLAPDYHTAEFQEGPSTDVIPDWTHIDTWQALSRACYGRDIAAKMKEGKDVQELEAAKAKIAPADPEIEEKVAALLRFSDQKQAGQLLAALKKGRCLEDSALEAALPRFKQEVLRDYPQILV